MPLTKQDVVDAIAASNFRYTDTEGNEFIGAPVSQVPDLLRDARWRNVSRIDACDLRKMGIEVTQARYTGGVRAKRFCDVAVARR